MLKSLLYLILSFFGFAQSGRFEEYLSTLDKKFSTVKQINLDEFKKLKSFLLYDVRSVNEYYTSRISNAEFIEYKEPDFNKFSELDKNSKIVLYCSVGYRSSVIAEKLMKMGFKNVYNLRGGVFNWANKNQTLINNNGQITKKLHTYDKKWGRYVTNNAVVKVN